LMMFAELVIELLAIEEQPVDLLLNYLEFFL